MRTVTDLELFQAERIKALEAEVLRLKNELASKNQQDSSRRERVIQLVKDPTFDKPIHNVRYQ